MLYCCQQMTPKWNECSSNNYRELSSLENGECKADPIETTHSCTSCFGLPTANRMCSLSAQKKDGNVYKRRKMDKDSNSLAACEEAKESTTSEDHSSLLKPIVPFQTMILSSKAGTTDPILDNEEPAGVHFKTMVLSSKAGTTDPILDNEEPAGVPTERSSDMNDKCMVSTEIKGAAECSSSNISPIELITELTSPRDICIAILKKDGLITESRTRIETKDLNDNDTNPLLACNTCGAMDRSLKMLICDSCEAAFHLFRCIPSIEELPTDEWFCKTCSLTKPKGLYGKLSEGKVKPSRNTNQRPHGMSHIEYMLKDTEQYVSGARIGRDFQADVPEWSGPTYSTDGYFDEPYEFDPVELTPLNWRKISNECSRASIGNWLQCRERVNFGQSDKICGKWRRVPLHVDQSDDFDCSCCLLWDPARADCAVPQELQTSEVLKQLKFVSMLKNRLVGQRKKS